MANPGGARSKSAGGAAVVEPIPLLATDDAALARAITQGHPGAARVVWTRFSPLVRGLLVRTLGPGDVEDHLQESLLRLFRHVGELRDPSALTQFVIGITLRVARSELRRRRYRRWLRLTPAGVLPEAGQPARDFAAREALTALYAILDRIDDDARIVFVMRYVQGEDLATISGCLGCSLATTKRRLASASKRIVALSRAQPALAPYVQEGGLAKIVRPVSAEEDGHG